MHIKFKKERFHDNDESTIKFLYDYHLYKDDHEISEVKTIVVHLSNLLALQNNYVINSKNHEKDHQELRKVLFLYAKNEVEKLFRAGILKKREVLKITTKSNPNFPDFVIENLEEPEGAVITLEYSF